MLQAVVLYEHFITFDMEVRDVFDNVLNDELSVFSTPGRANLDVRRKVSRM